MSTGIHTTEGKMGPCRIFWGPAGSETELGMTEDGIKIKIDCPVEDFKCDEYGEEPVDQIEQGNIVTCAMTLLQFDNAQMLIAVPGSAAGTGTTTTGWHFGKQAGASATGTDRAKRLRVHPVRLTDTTDQSEDMVLYSVALRHSGEIPFASKQKRGLVVVGQAFRDSSKADGKQFGYYKTDAP